MTTNFIQLKGRLFIGGNIYVKTGLHIGGAASGLQIGGLDHPVIRDPVTRQPYIPGSSLKGKMRSLAERQRGFNPDNEQETQKIGSNTRIHICKDESAYAKCEVCPLFGVPGDLGHSTPTRLTVRDVFLQTASVEKAQTDFLSTEVKVEVAIDRITSAANPRQIERVPAGAIFEDFEMALSVYDFGQGIGAELKHLRSLLKAMQMLEDDYLGGMGSRGYGAIQFGDISVWLRKADGQQVVFKDSGEGDLLALMEQQEQLVQWVEKQLFPPKE